MAIYYIGKGLWKIAKGTGLVALGAMGGFALAVGTLVRGSDDFFADTVQYLRELRNASKNYTEV